MMSRMFCAMNRLPLIFLISVAGLDLYAEPGAER